MIDYHTHSVYSDGKSTYEEILSQALNKGFHEIGFSDHYCIQFPGWAIQKGNLKKVKDDILRLKEQNNVPIKIKFGLEVDYFEDKQEEIANVLSGLPLDYVIGSIHFVGNWNFDTSPKAYPSKDIDEFYYNYYRLLQMAARSGLFDIMGHIDLVKKFNYFPGFKLSKIFSETAEVFSESGVAIEFNTSGKDRPCNEFYPSDEFLKACYNHNVPITLGSDAHHANEIGRYFPEVIEKLKNMGYHQIATYTNRTKSFISI